MYRKKARRQRPLGPGRAADKDRGQQRGGRSFYFFDFDGNVAFLSTPILIFHRKTGQSRMITCQQYGAVKEQMGVAGTAYEDYAFDYDDAKGSFRYFRDRRSSWTDWPFGKPQVFVDDMEQAMKEGIDLDWQAPSWQFFYHACQNQRPISIITARGHRPATMKKGLEKFVEYGHLPRTPNYLAIYPVHDSKTRRELGDHQMNLSVPELKRRAVKASVDLALRRYGDSALHRFGMSDDDPRNIGPIEQAMGDLKQSYPHMSFWVIDTGKGEAQKREILGPSQSPPAPQARSGPASEIEQRQLFRQ